MKFAGSHILSVGQFERADVERFSPSPIAWSPMPAAAGSRGCSRARFSAPCSSSPARVRGSASAAPSILLGGEVRETTGFENSAIAKGESLYDTARVLSGYSDVIAMRHPAEGSVAEFAAASRVPVINGGDGSNEHPSQALLDLYTIRSELAAQGAASMACASPWSAICASGARCTACASCCAFRRASA
jgi:aspartate carbamoyltransferase catalytic subunit